MTGLILGSAGRLSVLAGGGGCVWLGCAAAGSAASGLSGSAGWVLVWLAGSWGLYGWAAGLSCLLWSWAAGLCCGLLLAALLGSGWLGAGRGLAWLACWVWDRWAVRLVLGVCGLSGCKKERIKEKDCLAGLVASLFLLGGCLSGLVLACCGSVGAWSCWSLLRAGLLRGCWWSAVLACCCVWGAGSLAAGRGAAAGAVVGPLVCCYCCLAVLWLLAALLGAGCCWAWLLAVCWLGGAGVSGLVNAWLFGLYGCCWGCCGLSAGWLAVCLPACWVKGKKKKKMVCLLLGGWRAGWGWGWIWAGVGWGVGGCWAAAVMGLLLLAWLWLAGRGWGCGWRGGAGGLGLGACWCCRRGLGSGLGCCLGVGCWLLLICWLCGLAALLAGLALGGLAARCGLAGLGGIFPDLLGGGSL